MSMEKDMNKIINALIVAGEFGVVYKGNLLTGERKVATDVVAIKTLKGTNLNQICKLGPH